MKLGVKNTLMTSGAGFATPLLTFARLLTFLSPQAKWLRLTNAKRFGRDSMPRPAWVLFFVHFVSFVDKSWFLA